MSDNERRRKLARLSFTEKIKILDKLRARSLAFAEARKKLQAESAQTRSNQNKRSKNR